MVFVKGTISGLSVALAILTSALIIIVVQNLLPSGHGPEYAFLSIGDEVIGVSLTGAVIPVCASGLIITIWMGTRRESVLRPFRSYAYWLVVGATSVLVTLVFSISHDLYGGLSLPGSGPTLSVVTGSIMGVGYWYFRGRRLRWLLGASESFVLGTLSMFGSDLIRTFSGLATAPGAALVWGGGGLHDLILWFGLYIMLAFTAIQFYLPLLRRLSEAFRQAEREVAS